MKEFWRDFKPIAIIYAAWRFFLLGIEFISPKFFALQTSFLGPTPWANFDGVHYLTIARVGYLQYLQAFFPLYPLLIRGFSYILRVDMVFAGLGISQIATFFGLYFVYKLGQLYDRKNAFWILMILLVYPASFFYASMYPSGLYFLFASATLYAIEKRRWWWVGILGALASAASLFGVYLILAAGVEFLALPSTEKRKHVWKIFIMPVGLIAYMTYLWISLGDPLAFFHQQPLFGANRSGSELIMLPQVVLRYGRIFVTASRTTFIYQVAALEFSSFVFAGILLLASWKKGLKKSYLLYALAAIITPTLTGTLSSFPRYLQAAFPLFFVMGKLPFAVKCMVIVIFAATLVYFGSAFLRGYFIS